MSRISEVLNQLKYKYTVETKSFEDNQIDVFTTNKYLDESRDKIMAKYIIIDCFDIQLKVIADNFESFQEAMISEAFYSHRDDIRWNIYAFIIVDNRNAISKKHFDIEKNEDFARKFVFDVCDLRDFLEYGFLGKIHPSERSQIKTNFILEWDKYLSEHSLNGCIYNKINTGSVEEYIVNAKPIRPIGRPSEKQTNSQADDKTIVRKINKLHINNYRPHCFCREFVFLPSHVNLISGSNGSGKSSICEAIEFGMSGISKRGESVKVYCDNTKGEEICISSEKPSTYCRELDLTWYGTTTTGTKSRLSDNFAIFNYLKPNAIYNNQDNINELLKNIMYGEETTYAWKNIQNYKEKFFAQKKVLKKSVQDLLQKKFETENRLSSIILADSSNKLSIDDKFNLLSVIPSDFEIQDKLGMLNSLEYSVAVINDGIKMYPYINSFSDISQKVKNLEKELTSISKEKNLSESQEKEISSEKLRISTNEKQIEQLNHLNNNLSQFYSEYNSISYSNVDTKEMRDNFGRLYYDNNTKLNRLKSIMIDYKPLEFCEGGNDPQIEVLFEKTKTRCNALLKQHEEVKICIEEKQKNSSLIKKVIADIFKLAKDYQAVHKENTKCPLCGHEYKDSEEMENAIGNASALNYNLDSETKRMMSKEQEIREKYRISKKELETLENEISTTNKLKEFVDRLNEIGIVTDSDIAMSVYKRGLEEVALLESSLAKSKVVMEFLEEHSNSNFILEFDSQSSINSLSAFLKDKQQYIESNISKAHEEMNAIEIKLTNLENELLDKEYINSRYEDILEQVSTFDITVVGISHIRKVLNNIDDEFNIKEWINSFNNLKIYLEENLKRENENALRVSLEKSLQDDEKVLPFAEAKLKRCEIAIKAFDNLTSLEKNMSDFITENATRIGKIFKMIHKPDEFTDLRIENDSIKFVRKTTGEVIDINNISTGQAFSLVFAMTICLHFSAKNAPNLLIFDEPVANLDDVHIMNLADILKEIALMGVQLFITTANDQVATYFRRKFSCLTDDFKHLEILRTDENPSVFIENVYEPYKESPIIANRICDEFQNPQVVEKLEQLVKDHPDV